MTATETDWTRTRRATTTWLAWHPGWPLGVLGAAAWVVLVATTPRVGASAPVPAAPGGSASWVLACPIPLAGGPTATGGSGLAAALVGWGVMVVAMMVPAMLPAADHVGLNSIRRRRGRAIGLFATTAVGTWVVAGVVVLVPLLTVPMTTSVPLVGVALVVAAAWQFTPWKRRATVLCGRPIPLPPFGRRADAACVRFGLQQGLRCLQSGWALLLVMAVVGHGNLPVMVGLTVLALLEGRVDVGERLRRPVGLVLAVLAIPALAVA